jgi:hypothetical protein
VAITNAGAIAELAFAVGYNGGHLPVYLNGKPNPEHMLSCEPPRARAGERLGRIAANADLEHSAEVAIGLPTIKEFVFNSTILWAWVRSGEQVERAAAFKPRPSIVLKIGGQSNERLLIWVLRQPIAAELVMPHNARISYCLHAPRTRSRPEALRIPLPGTFMRVGRSVPAAILVTRLEIGPKLHTFEQITGKLKDPPPADAWKDAKKR